MAVPSDTSIVARLARCVDLFRDPNAKEEQKAAFRALMESLQSEAFRLRDEGGTLVVNGKPVDGAVVGSLSHRLALHNISEFSILRRAPPVEVFELLKALAEPAALDGIPNRLRAAGAHSIVVALGTASIPRAESGPPDGGLGTDGILRGDPMSDIKSPKDWVQGVPRLTYDPLPPPPEMSLPAQGLGGLADAVLPEVGAGPPAAAAPMPPAAPPPVAPPPPPAAPKAPTHPLSGADKALEQLAREPQAPGVGAVLAALGEEAEDALRGNRIELFLSIVMGVVRQEQRATAESARRHYGIALRRMLPESVLQRLASLVTVPTLRVDAVGALRRSGARGVQVLLDRLIAATSVAERRGAFDALRQMSEGTEQVIQMLDHDEWYVVRNMAELAGELGMEEAVPALARQLAHADERVRKATALALAKIGTSGAAEALRRALRDKSADVRMQVALGVGGRRSIGLVLALVAALDEEKDEAVQRELILALGRIGTPDAVQALIKVSQAPRRLFGRRPTALRIAAIEALRLAGTAPAIGTLEGLAEESDRQVSAAAKAALEETKRPPKR
jgi:hypothetical protein